MGRLEIRVFADEHLDGAAELLAQRQRRHRLIEPLLPERFEDPAAAREEAEAVWRTDDASGAVALLGNRVTGYLVGAPREDPAWGPNVWVELAGHAVEEAETTRDLYAFAAARWADEGRTRQYALVPASDAALVDTWFRLSFGQQHAMGIRELPWSTELPDGTREGTEDDLDALVALAPLLGDHQALSPVFGSHRRDWTDEELREDIAKDLASPEVGNLLAEVEGRVVGNFVVVPVESSSVHGGVARPAGAAFLGFAITAPEARGSGAGVALTEACFAWARARGYETMVTDWRVTNLLSSRFWPRRGFRPTFLRLYRSIP
jgi:GNAT superfamily N-acetyltransferase